jgi:hypothetical protein
MTTNIKPTSQKLKKIINKCDFLDENFREEWSDKADGMSEDDVGFVYKRFVDAKNKIDNVYISIALKHDPTDGDLVREAMNLIKKFNK